MTLPSVTPSEIRRALLLREEIALLDVRHEAAFATGHPLFAPDMTPNSRPKDSSELTTRAPQPLVR
jgi:rhodanese-related sulfurtransferase